MLEGLDGGETGSGVDGHEGADKVLGEGADGGPVGGGEVVGAGADAAEEGVGVGRVEGLEAAALDDGNETPCQVVQDVLLLLSAGPRGPRAPGACTSGRR